jgi:hypothetical protein
MKKNVGEQSVRADDAVFKAAIHARDRRGVFLGIEVAFFHYGFANAFVFFELEGFDPGHAASSLKSENQFLRGLSPASAIAKIGAKAPTPAARKEEAHER